MKYYLIAGERSGDLHGSNLMKELAKQDSGAEFRFFGGDYMAAVGGSLTVHYRDLAFMGFLEVVSVLWVDEGADSDHCKPRADVFFGQVVFARLGLDKHVMVLVDHMH